MAAPTRRAAAKRHPARARHPVTADVNKILGRPARTFADWVTDHVKLFDGPDDND
ncbi:hypothetical protein ACFLIM_31670 [Nonomuraea sp. M3C6]|uniref:Uncharacterized protein n=1 Tax=Nonomuraea marmarensis TaxID=3351344 RepID=A0ABW7AKX7_9ACTN